MAINSEALIPLGDGGGGWGILLRPLQTKMAL